MQLEGLGERCKLPQRGLGRNLTEIEFGAFLPQNLTSGGNKFNDFHQNPMTKFHAEFPNCTSLHVETLACCSSIGICPRLDPHGITNSNWSGVYVKSRGC